jgi:hypothetical protein
MTPTELAHHFQHAGLEGLEPDDLRAFSAAAQNPILFGRMLFPKRTRSFSLVVPLLAGYADRTARAMELRKKGLVTSAMHIEQVADTIYNQLPEFAKW